VTQSPTNKTYYVAPFVFNGEFLGVAEWNVSDLSVRWLGFARELLCASGSSFKCSLPDPFERVSLKFTSTQGAALVNFELDGMPAASSVYLRGDNMVTELEVLQMFVKSMRGVEAVRRTQATSEPFNEIFSVTERPLHIVIPWPTDEKNDSIIRELNNHFAVAFFQGSQGR